MWLLPRLYLQKMVVSLFKKFFLLLQFLFGGIEHIHHVSIRVFFYAILRRTKARIGSRREQCVIPNTEDVQNSFLPFIEATDEIFEVRIIVGLVIDAGDRALWLEKFIRPKCPTCLIGNNINGCKKRLSKKQCSPLCKLRQWHLEWFASTPTLKPWSLLLQ